MTCLIRGGVILSSSVKQDGWLREHVCAFLKSVNIWSGVASQPPFKVEISSKVLVLLCFIGICLFFYNFHGFFVVLKLEFNFSMCFCLVLVNQLKYLKYLSNLLNRLNISI